MLAARVTREALIARENARGIPATRIVVAGFFRGDVVALYTGLQYPQGTHGTRLSIQCVSGFYAQAVGVNPKIRA